MVPLVFVVLKEVLQPFQALDEIVSEPFSSKLAVLVLEDLLKEANMSLKWIMLG